MEEAGLGLAEFTSIEWNDTRRVCTITAQAGGASKILISAGYSPNLGDIKSKQVTGSTISMSVEDLDHGTGQLLYLSAIPIDSEGAQRPAYGVWKTVPIPNPILGVTIPDCEKEDGKQEYIVDIIEHKIDNSCTPRWQVGDRLVIQEPCCLSSTPPEGGIINDLSVAVVPDETLLGNSSFEASVGPAYPYCSTCPTCSNIVPRALRAAHMVFKIDVAAAYPNIDFTNPNIIVKDAGSGWNPPSNTGAPSLVSTSVYNSSTHITTFTLGAPAGYTGEYYCWNAERYMRIEDKSTSPSTTLGYIFAWIGGDSDLYTSPDYLIAGAGKSPSKDSTSNATILYALKEATVNLRQTS